mmetsp:Transcript_11190/g.15511  ORF Transcript_11190/g.15511 Transcript_11190/m.15511 type:complete len:207 (-) Transcript_11190:3094-3714(-)
MRTSSLPSNRSIIASILLTFLGSCFSKSSRTFPRISSALAASRTPLLALPLAGVREDVGFTNFDPWLDFGVIVDEGLGAGMRDCITCAFRALMVAAEEASFALRTSAFSLLISFSFSFIFLSNSSPSLCTFRSFCCTFFNSFCTFSNSCTCSSRLTFSFCHLVVISALLFLSTSIVRFSSIDLDLDSELWRRRSCTRSFSRFRECI